MDPTGAGKVFGRATILMGSSSQDKKRKLAEKTDTLEVGDRIEPQSLVPAIDTSNWPLLLKVRQHYHGPQLISPPLSSCRIMTN